MDNQWFLAMHTFHQHKLPTREGYYAFNYPRNEDGTPHYPQRDILIAHTFTEAASGRGIHTGNNTGKMIVIDNLLDNKAFLWEADWYQIEEVTVLPCLLMHAKKTFFRNGWKGRYWSTQSSSRQNTIWTPQVSKAFRWKPLLLNPSNERDGFLNIDGWSVEEHAYTLTLWELSSHAGFFHYKILMFCERDCRIFIDSTTWLFLKMMGDSCVAMMIKYSLIWLNDACCMPIASDQFIERDFTPDTNILFILHGTLVSTIWSSANQVLVSTTVESYQQ